MNWRDHKAVHWTLVLIVFACTGMTVARLCGWLVQWMGHEKFGWVYWLMLLALLPVYNVLLLVYGFLFGKYSYFRSKQKKMWRRWTSWFRRKDDGK